MECRRGCGACCIAMSISSALPGMPNGKPAGVRCVNLADDNACRVHNGENYPAICRRLQASEDMCGQTFDEAFAIITEMERLTRP